MKYLTKLVNRLIKNPAKITEYGIYLVSFLLFFINSSYVSYPDEFVNLMGGKYILLGRIPYRQFFDHHLPLAWYLAAFIQLFSFKSYVLFRFWWMVIMFAGFLGAGVYLKKTNPGLHKFYLLFLLLYPLVAVYFWLHLYLADSLAAWFFSLIFWLLIAETFADKVNRQTLLVISFLTFCLVFSSMTYIYLAAVLYLWQLYLLVRKKYSLPTVIKYLFWCLLPYVLYLLVLVLTNSLKEFYISNIYYNTQLYIDLPNYVRGRFFNPLKFALTLIFNFYQNYLSLLTKIKFLDLYLRAEVLFGLATFLFIFLLFFKDKILFILFFLLLSFSSPRANVQQLDETNYQAGIFIALGLICSLLVLWVWEKIEINEELLKMFKKMGAFILMILLLFNSMFLAKNTYDKWFQRYTQKMPSIVNLSYSAEFIDKVLPKGESYWIGPYEPHEAFFVKSTPPTSKYITLLPQFRQDEYFKADFLNQLAEKPPAIIIYKHEASIFMTPAMEFGKFFVDWMADKYTSLENIKQAKVVSSPPSFNLSSDLYLLNSKKEVLLQSLASANYIQIESLNNKRETLPKSR